MRMRNKLIIAAAIVVGVICLTILLASVSLYGENRKIDGVVNIFFEKIKNKEYQDVCSDLSRNNKKTFFSTSGPCSDSIFLLELSLLKHYILLKSDSYRVKVERPRLWTPFSQDCSMTVDIALEGSSKDSTKKVLSIKKLFSSVKDYFTTTLKSDAPFVKGLLTVERINGMWRIVDINIDNTVIGPEYAGLKKQLHLGRYVRETPDGLIIERVEVHANGLTPVDKRVLNYNLQKIQNLIGNK